MISWSRQFRGFQNYMFLFERAEFRQSVVVTVSYVLMTVPLEVVLAGWVANTIANMKARAALVSTTLVFLPFMVSMVAAGIVWNWLFDPALGLVNVILNGLGIVNAPKWLLSGNTALISTVIITFWIRLPFGIMILYGGIKSVPPDLYEVADLEGVNSFQRFFRITLPLINPQIVLVLTLETIFAFRAFDQIFAATAGGPAGATRTLMIFMISDLFRTNYGMASALTVLLVLALFIISVAQQLLLRRVVEY
jgi:multiple sugar transport system permease protein/sn-glycerol 3-phosphate transport system permease protein